jgi:putative hydrolase of the HAD superfamily
VGYRAVFFDAGETLVHPHPSFPELLTLTLREEGLEVDPALIREKLHVVSDRFARSAREGELWSTSPERSRKFWSSVYGGLLAEMGLAYGDGLADRLYSTFTDLSNYRLFPDVERALERLLAARLRLGVISNFEEWLERLLESLDATRFFEVRIISGVEGMEKPDPRIFHLALDRLGVRADESVYVGDNPMFDIEPALEVGMFAVLLDRRGRFPDHPGVRITSLEDLPAAIHLAA